MNVIVDTPASGFVENGWLERPLAVGDGARLEVAEYDSRCVMTTLAQADLPEDPEILRTM